MTEIAAFDHPAQPNWYLRGVETFNTIGGLSHLKQFGNDAPQIMHAMSVAIRHANGNRASYEQMGISKLLLTEEELAEYRELAGDPDRLPELSLWFPNQVALAAVRVIKVKDSESEQLARLRRQLGNRKEAQKTAIELGGATILGAWPAAEALDAKITDTLDRVGERPDTAVEKFEDRQHPKMLGYTVYPLRGTDGKYEWDQKYMTVQRLRMRADLLHGGIVVEFYRKTRALLALDYVPDAETRAQLVTPFTEARNHDALKSSYARNSAPALVAGKLFEVAISEWDAAKAKSEDEVDMPKTIVPMNVQHIMQARTSERVLLKLYGPERDEAEEIK